MKKSSFLTITLAILLLIVAGNFSISAKPADCSKTTDADLIKTVVKKINGKFKKQKNHINIHIEGGVVTIEGWVVTQKDKDKITAIIKKIKCVKEVTNNLGIGTGGGCDSGTKPCGEICIPLNQTCNISTVKG